MTETESNGPIDPEMRKRNNELRIPLHRYGRPEDMAEAALYLLRQDCVTGEHLAVDGGFGMRLA